jgi:glucose/arabinose dehydrogenase
MMQAVDWLRSLAVGALLLSGASVAGTPPTLSTLVEGLEYPWSLAFLPDGRILVSERPGRLRVIADGRLLAEPVSGLPPVLYAGQGGLFDVLPAPDFASSGWLYLSYAHAGEHGNTTRLARGRLVGGTLLDVEVLFSALPERATAVHFGGRMAWLADGSLLLGLGDGFDYRERAQALDDHLGSIVRLRADGGVPADNPFATSDDALPEIYSYGHRNVQGMVVVADAAGDERVYAHEHGPRGGDELNLILPGANYGWPLATSGLDYSGARISPFDHRPDTEQALLQWTPSIAPAGMAWYDDARHPIWQGSLFVAALAERSLRRVRLHADGRIEQERIALDLDERLRDVRVGPDGALYLLTDSAEGRLLRLVPPDGRH